MNPPERVSIVVFGFNEAPSLVKFLPELRSAIDESSFESELIFVDDGSTDNTAEIIKNSEIDFAQVIQRPNRGGIGRALRDGFRAATGGWVTFLPADGQIDPTAVAKLFSRAENTDVVFSIYNYPHGDWKRELLSKGIRMLIQAMFFIQVESDGPYLFRRHLFDEKQLHSETFVLNFEFPIRVRRAGLVYQTVALDPRPRLEGESKSANLATIRCVAQELLSLRSGDLAKTWHRWFA